LPHNVLSVICGNGREEYHQLKSADSTRIWKCVLAILHSAIGIIYWLLNNEISIFQKKAFSVVVGLQENQ
jgi:hypothetical protein